MKNLRLFIFSFLNIFLLFRVDIIFLPGWAYICGFLGLALLFCSYKNYYGILYTIIFVVIALVFSLVLASGDYSYSKMLFSLLYKIGICYFSFYLFKMLFRSEYSVDLYFRSVVLSMVIVSISSLVLIMIPSLSSMWIDVVVPGNIRLLEGYSTRKSLLGYTGFDELCIYAPSLFFCIFFMAEKINNHKSYVREFVQYCIIVVGCLIYGRVSAVTILLTWLLFLLIVRNKVKFLKMLIIAIILFVVLYKGLYYMAADNITLLYWLDWAFEPINAIMNKTSVGSFNTMKRMYDIPSGGTLLFGDGKYNVSSGYYKSTDIGYLRTIYFYGLFGLILNTTIIVSLYRIIKRELLNGYKMIVMFIILNIMIYEFKGISWDSLLIYLPLIYYNLAYSNQVRMYQYES